ncbi:hypothetical protein K2173_012306 [Erythroxylum novogranatense]|uniref:Protein kinase domain-containing protein n=1 Tax=Erythroxylum novogranatense TaxID=1862640 RepID=A0AAV8SC46_9ROSI|nr:hypothetical protein K2173_012306 [Erythroxylum novogranatense]
MDGWWWVLNRAKLRMAFLAVVVLLFHQNFSFCWALNTEGLALLRFRDEISEDPFGALSNWEEKDESTDPCFWFGIECSDGKVVTLTLKDLCLKGTLTPELGRLGHLKSIILRNNSFFGSVPKEIGQLKELEELDLGYNNLSGPVPNDFANNLSLTTLLLDNNKYLGSLSPELHELEILSEFQTDESQLRASCNCRYNIRKVAQPKTLVQRYLLQVANAPNSPKSGNRKVHHIHSEAPSPSALTPLLSPSVSPSDPTLLSPSFSISPSIAESPSFPPEQSSFSFHLSPPPSPSEAPTPPAAAPVTSTSRKNDGLKMAPVPSPNKILNNDSRTRNHVLLVAGIVGSSLLLISAIGLIVFIRSSKVVTVRPWATGLSGQLQKAFVTGVPKLKRSELEAACEDFSNIIGSFSDGTVYKGTLSSGVEIAVTSPAIKSCEDWSKTLETQFRKKIDTLSKVNHKNFINLIGYCEEDEPFTRMMVFEYAPNGTLFEHLHVKESEHLNWGARLRIAVGMAYCIEHMHQLTPPITHKSLQSSSVYLTEDYAAKISDFSFWNDATAEKMGSLSMELLENSLADLDNDIYSFGVILLEMITGRMPFVMGNGSLADWVSGCLQEEQPLRETVDPTLKTLHEDELRRLLEVIKSCIHPDPEQRPTMREIAAKLKEITSMGPDGACPKLSPLWWAELEIMSTEGS